MLSSPRMERGWTSRASVRSSLLLLFPAAALLIGLFIYPVGYSVYLGFTNLQLIGPNSIHFRFTGLQNVYFLLSDRFSTGRSG